MTTVNLATYSLDFMAIVGKTYALTEDMREIHDTNGENLGSDPTSALKNLLARITEIKILIRDAIDRANDINTGNISDELRDAILNSLDFLSSRLEILEINEAKVNDTIIQLTTETATGTLIDDIHELVSSIDGIEDEDATEDAVEDSEEDSEDTTEDATEDAVEDSEEDSEDTTEDATEDAVEDTAEDTEDDSEDTTEDATEETDSDSTQTASESVERRRRFVERFRRFRKRNTEQNEEEEGEGEE